MVGLGGKQFQWKALALIPIGLVAAWLIAGLALFERFVNVPEASEPQTLYAEIFNIFRQLLVNGQGLGIFREIYVTHHGENTFLVYFVRADSEYLELLLSVGFPGFVLQLPLLGQVRVKIFHRVRGKPSRPVLMAILLATLIHVIIDFPFQTPSMSYLFVAVIACFLLLLESKAHGESILTESQVSYFETPNIVRNRVDH